MVTSPCACAPVAAAARTPNASAPAGRPVEISAICLLPFRFFWPRRQARQKIFASTGEKDKGLEGSGRCRAIYAHLIASIGSGLHSAGSALRTVVLQDRRPIRVPLAALRSFLAPLPQEAAKLQRAFGRLLYLWYKFF